MEIRTSTDQTNKDFLLKGLEEYAKQFTNLDTFEKHDFGFYAYDNGKLIGGICGKEKKGNWLYVELFYLDSKYRGQDLGTKLMNRVVELATQKGCIGIYTDTLSFEARGFYEKMGFVLHGELTDYPLGHSKYFLHKRLK